MKKFSEFITESKIDEALNGKTLVDMSKFSNMFMRERAETIMNTVLSFFKTIGDMNSDEYTQYLGLSNFKENLDKAVGEFSKTFYNKVYPEYNKFIKDNETYNLSPIKDDKLRSMIDRVAKKFKLKISDNGKQLQITGPVVDIGSFSAYIHQVPELKDIVVYKAD